MGSSSVSVSVGGMGTNPNKVTHNVFVYGSLLADEVVSILLNRVPPSSPALLNNHHRFSIKGRVYPAILPVENKKVTGKDSSEKLQAHAYVWANNADPDLYGDWDFEEWKVANMKDFMKMTMGFVEELKLPESKPRVETYESFYQKKEDTSSLP